MAYVYYLFYLVPLRHVKRENHGLLSVPSTPRDVSAETVCWIVQAFVYCGWGQDDARFEGRYFTAVYARDRNATTAKALLPLHYRIYMQR